MQLAKEAGKTFKSITFIHQLNDSFQIQLFNSSVSRCPLSHIQIYFFFLIELCVIGTAEKIRFHPPKVFATSRSIIQVYFYTESSILFTSKSGFQILSTLLFWVVHKTYYLRDFPWTAKIIFKSILRSQSLLSLHRKNVMLVISLRISVL